MGRVLRTVEDVMVDLSLVRIAGWTALLLLVPASLRKFKKQSQNAGVQVKLEVEKNLAKVLVLGPAEPEKAYLLLRETQFLLDEADALPRGERDMLMRRLDDGFRDAKARLDSKKQLTQTQPAGDVAGQVLLVPNIRSFPEQASAQVTPVVSPDRRWVRISFSGSFFLRTR
jgi:hypothetical protein